MGILTIDKVRNANPMALYILERNRGFDSLRPAFRIALSRAGITELWQTIEKSVDDLMRIRGIGPVAVLDVTNLLRGIGIEPPMRLSMELKQYLGGERDEFAPSETRGMHSIADIQTEIRRKRLHLVELIADNGKPSSPGEETTEDIIATLNTLLSLQALLADPHDREHAIGHMNSLNAGS